MTKGENGNTISRLQHRHLLGLSTYSAEEIRLILETAKEFRAVLERPIKRVPTLREMTICNLFYEASTRTRLSFELAEKRLSADIVNFSPKNSSVCKGESLKDTARNIEAMKVDMVVVRHSSPGVPHFLTRCTGAQIVNAGDGAREHPTQALLDLYTIGEHFDSIEGLRVCIVGDITHSRVARSNIIGMSKLGAKVTLCAPPTLLPYKAEALGVNITHNLEEALSKCEVVMALRLQMERQSSGLFPGVREYHTLFGIKPRHLDQYPKLLVMHPGPVNRGVELASDVLDHERTIVLDQVTNGVAVRMAILYLLAASRDRN